VAADLTFERLLAVVQGRDDVLGLYLFGSRGRGLMVDERSDWDVCVVLRDDESLERFDAQYPYEHGARVEIASTTLAALRERGAIGSPSEWGRYAAAHFEVLLDKTAETSCGSWKRRSGSRRTTATGSCATRSTPT